MPYRIRVRIGRRRSCSVERCTRAPSLCSLSSPHSKKGVVNHTHTEKASIPKLVEELWGMKTLADYDDDDRDKKAGNMMSAFDFKQPPWAPFLLKTHPRE